MFLKDLNYPIANLPGVGKHIAGQMKGLGIESISGLLTHYPRAYENRMNPVRLNEAYKFPEGVWINTVATVRTHDYFFVKSRQTLKIYIEDESAGAALVCFNRRFLAGKFPPDSVVSLYGFFQVRYGEIQSSRFEIEIHDPGSDDFTSILPVYPLSGTLTQQHLRKSLRNALNLYAKNIANELPAWCMEKRGLLDKKDALNAVHFPGSPSLCEKARYSLVFEELFYLQLIILRRTLKRREAVHGRSPLPLSLQTHILSRLPWALTPDQETAINKIMEDMSSPVPMMRLLQGDVGCGKTLVAFLAAAACVEAGYQAAFMAPTELLARQHADNAARILGPLGVKVALLTGGVTGEGKKGLLNALAAGEVDFVVGTHALFSERVRYKHLRLVIVDEQHKFGVLQRLALVAKGMTPDMLLMTATPIPRTITLTAFGDMDISTIKTMPAGRKPVITHLARDGNEEKVYRWVNKELDAGRQAYVVCPLIEESEKIDLKSAESLYESLAQGPLKGRRLGIIHSRIPEDVKKSVMDAFIAGSVQVLIATSVVEVGVDVPNATCLIVVHAERFGLSSLHQLRGRVGRGNLQSFAFLIYSENLTEDAKERLKVLKETTDGFLIAEKDLELRGPGEMTGVKQSGAARLAIADIVRDYKTMLIAREDVAEILRRDPGMLEPVHAMVRETLIKKSEELEYFLDSG